MEGERELVCVTGGSGFCAAHLIKRLLERGYTVRASVRDPDDPTKTNYLRNFVGANERLELVKANLLNEMEIDSLVQGCHGVFHLASPKMVPTDDVEKHVVQPIVSTTMNVLKACAKSSSLKRIVHMSSIATLFYGLKDSLAPDATIDENFWTSTNACRLERDPIWPYVVGKTLAEKEAFDFASKNKLCLTTILPSLMMGAFFSPQPPKCVLSTIGLLRGNVKGIPMKGYMPYVHVDDVAMASIFLYECKDAMGRYICNLGEDKLVDIANMLQQRYVELNPSSPSMFEGDGHQHYSFSSKRLTSLGFTFKHTLENAYDDIIQCLREKNLLQTFVP